MNFEIKPLFAWRFWQRNAGEGSVEKDLRRGPDKALESRMLVVISIDNPFLIYNIDDSLLKKNVSNHTYSLNSCNLVML